MSQPRQTDSRKIREICFCRLHPDDDQALTALQLLSGMDEVDAVRRLSDHCIEVEYRLRHVRLKMLEEFLVRAGFHLDNSLMTRLKRALWHYTEQVEYDNLQLPSHTYLDTTEVFINRYRHLRHGCRDDRPEHWRKYL
ncbi:MAG: hypothetical protein Kow006_05670 [Gammaproteobacteria bacterium]